MPFTLFHLGPGAACKALGGRRFSFTIFAGSQILMDIEPLIGMLRDSDVLHGYTHTLLGAFILGTLTGILGKPLTPLLLKRLAIPHISHIPYIPCQQPTWLVSLISAYIGTFSHVLLDAIMHADMLPGWPLSSANPLLGVISIECLQWSCVLAGILGAAVIFIQLKVKARGAKLH